MQNHSIIRFTLTANNLEIDCLKGLLQSISFFAKSDKTMPENGNKKKKSQGSVMHIEICNVLARKGAKIMAVSISPSFHNIPTKNFFFFSFHIMYSIRSSQLIIYAMVPMSSIHALNLDQSLIGICELNIMTVTKMITG